METRTFAVQGIEGHRQRISFEKSVKYDFSDDTTGVRIIELICSDRTGTNDYVLIRITRNTERECIDEFFGQLSDGIFENANVGHYEDWPSKVVVHKINHRNYRYLACWKVGTCYYTQAFETIKDLKEYTAGWFCDYEGI